MNANQYSSLFISEMQTVLLDIASLEDETIEFAN